jgi:hypothetical protein
VTALDRDGRTRDAQALAATIAELGLRCSVEERGSLAVLLPARASLETLQSAETRRAVLALARQCGFTHVAIELPSDRPSAERDADAPLPRD